MDIRASWLDMLKIKLDTPKKIANLERATGVVSQALATEVQKRTAKYPPKSVDRKPGKTYYERGSGPVYVRKSGGVTKRKLSEMLGRKWDIVGGTNRAVLRNMASYSPYVHMKDDQARIHKRTGWKTVETALDEIDIDALAKRVLGGII